MTSTAKPAENNILLNLLLRLTVTLCKQSASIKMFTNVVFTLREINPNNLAEYICCRVENAKLLKNIINKKSKMLRKLLEKTSS